MSPAYAAYRLITSAAFAAGFPLLFPLSRCLGVDRTEMRQRLGMVPADAVRSASGRPRIWTHAVSVGEAGAALPVLDCLRRQAPGCGLILSTTTRQGQAFARTRAGENAACIFAPADAAAAVNAALRRIRPDVLICMETELWPNLIRAARKSGIKTALINGRISVRSFRRYMKIRPLIRETLDDIDALSMIGPGDADRIRRMGAPEARIEINGNAKFDALIRQPDAALADRMRGVYGFPDGAPVLVAGSTRTSEEEIVFRVFKQLRARVPDLCLIIAPRHVERAAGVKKIADRQGISCRFRSALTGGDPGVRVVILDAMGELQATYGMADAVFCGGSLVPLGGQNILEPAFWGKPLFFGPSMEDFAEARDLLLRANGCVQVRDEADLKEKLLECFTDREAAQAMGARARRAVTASSGAAGRHAAVVMRLLGR